jgi:hypothetical protein
MTVSAGGWRWVHHCAMAHSIFVATHSPQTTIVHFVSLA